MAVETEKIVNIPDVYTDPRFDKQIDQKSGHLTRSVLCMPITNSIGCTGVVQMINKLPGGQFTLFDEELLGIFGTFGSVIVNYKNLNESRIKAVNYIIILSFYIFEFSFLQEKLTEVFTDVIGYRLENRMDTIPISLSPTNFTISPPDNFDK